MRHLISGNRVGRWVLASVLIMLLFDITGCGENEVQKQRILVEKENLRFREVNTINFRYLEYRDTKFQKATIFEDTETGIQYMYMWGGMGNGGPAITRLWNK